MSDWIKLRKNLVTLDRIQNVAEEVGEEEVVVVVVMNVVNVSGGHLENEDFHRAINQHSNLRLI